MSIVLQPYSDKSIVVRGDTKPIKDELMKLGGKWNPSLSGGPGWIFSSKYNDQVKNIIDKCNTNSPQNTQNTPNNSQNVATENVRKRSYTTSTNNNSEVVLTRKEYLQLLSRIERIEQELKLKSLNEDVSKLITNIQPNVSFQNDIENEEDDEDQMEDNDDQPTPRKVQPLLRKKIN
jgi:hypothetical protein